jgi:hypothetical protein
MRYSNRCKNSRRPLRTEQGYVRSALIALRKRGVQAAWEAALLGRSVDLAFLLDDLVYTVEFKKRDWRRALVQAKDHLLGTDFAYICVAEFEPSEALLVEARQAGIGVVRFRSDDNWPFEVVVEAPPSQETWVVARDRLRTHLLAG